jgi:hypothetical protein
MSQQTGPIRHPRRVSSPPTPRIAGTLTAALVLLVTACVGSSATAVASTAPRSAIAFAHCMRSHHIQNWPDPEPDGQFDKSKITLQKLGVLRSQLQAAEKACQYLLPGSSQSPQSQDRTMMNAMLNFARCVRAHGVPNWPDPVAESDPGQPNTPGFPRNMPGVNLNSPQVKHATKTCQYLLASIGYASGGYP